MNYFWKRSNSGKHQHYFFWFQEIVSNLNLLFGMCFRHNAAVISIAIPDSQFLAGDAEVRLLRDRVNEMIRDQSTGSNYGESIMVE